MSFKIADAYVSVTSDDSTLLADLRSKIESAIEGATEGLEAHIGLGLSDAAPEDLRGDLDSALLLTTEGLEARVGMGLKDDAVENLDADVKAGIDLVQEDAKVKVGIDKKSADNTGAGLSTMLIGAFTLAGTVGPAALLMGTSAAIVGIGALVDKSNKSISADYTKLASTVETSIEAAVAPLTTHLEASVGILQQGVSSLSPGLTSLFAAVAPDAEAVASGMVQLAQDALPGITKSMTAIAPFMSSFADDAGKIGSGLGGFFAELGTGAAGGSSGLGAVATIVKQLLPDLGQVIGALSNGLGPALQDIDDVVGPVAKGLSDIVTAIPPGVIETAADAVTVLFAAFKVGILTNVLEEGTTFTQFLKGLGASSTVTAVQVTALGDAEEATAVKTGLMASAGAAGSKALTGLGAAAGTALKLGLVVGAAGMLGEELGKLSGVGAALGSIPQLTTSLLDASSGSQEAQQRMDALAASMAIMGKVSQSSASAGLTNVDQALSQLYATDPQQATDQFNSMAAAMKANGASTQEVTADFPAYTAAVRDAANATRENASAQDAGESAAQQFTTAVISQILALQTQEQTLLVNTTAANEALPAQAQLSAAVVNSEVAFQGATSATSSLTQAVTALYGKYGDTSDAQAALTTGLAGLSGQITKGTNAVNLNTTAGSKNFTAFYQVAQQAQTYAEKLYTQTQNAGLANQALQTSATNLDKVAAKAGLTTTQIQQLNTELYGVPDVKDITITADTTPAQDAISALIAQIDSTAVSTGTINVNMGAVKGTGQLPHKALGGHTPADQPIVVGDGGRPEVFVPDRSGTIIPSIPAANALFSGGGTTHRTTIQFYGTQYPTGEQMAQLHREFASIGSF